MSPDRSLYFFHVNMSERLAAIVDCGFDDLPELARHLQSMRSEIDQLEYRARVLEGEAREERETSIPPCGS